MKVIKDPVQQRTVVPGAKPECSYYTASDEPCQTKTPQNFLAALLQHGSENAISSEKLAALCGLSSTRQLRHIVTEARREGLLILADSNGYYMPSDDPDAAKSEIGKFTRLMAARLRSNREAVRGAQQALKAAGQEDQLSIFASCACDIADG